MKDKKVSMEQTRNALVEQPDIQDDEKRQTAINTFKKEIPFSQDSTIQGKLKSKQVEMILSL